MLRMYPRISIDRGEPSLWEAHTWELPVELQIFKFSPGIGPERFLPDSATLAQLFETHWCIKGWAKRGSTQADSDRWRQNMSCKQVFQWRSTPPLYLVRLLEIRVSGISNQLGPVVYRSGTRFDSTIREWRTKWFTFPVLVTQPTQPLLSNNLDE